MKESGQKPPDAGPPDAGPPDAGRAGKAASAGSPRSGRDFDAIAEHAGSAYLRYSFTRGTAQEVQFLVRVLRLRPGNLVLDLGCGPGRHAALMREQGLEVVGLDVSASFLRAAGPGRWVRADARELPLRSASFDAAISICQGGFGLLGGDDRDEGAVLSEMARVVRKGGRMALTAFSAYFVVRHLEPGESFDASAGVCHEVTRVRNPEGVERPFELRSTCFTPRELRLMAEKAGIEVEGLWSVRPGAYAETPPDLEQPEWLLLGLV